VLTKDGTFALAVLPIIVEKRAAGAIVLRAREPGMFDEGELRLLVELVSNIAFALEHMDQEEKVQRLTRVYAVLSGINTLIVRVHSRDELFQKACEIAVEAGGFRMAWIGLVDQAAQKIVPVASAGADAGFLANPRQWLSLTDELPGPAVMAVRDKQAVVVDELDSDPRMRDRKAHLDPGVRSLVILPLLVAGVPVAVFGLHALHAGYFDEQEMTLLRELAGDIAFAIDHIEKAVKFDKLARIRAVSSEINAAIIRIRERKALLEETCRIVAEHGKFEMAWIGALDHDAQQIEPVAWKGFSDQTARAVSWARISTAKGALSEAMLTRKASVRNDIGDGLPGGQLSGEALAQGCHASICLPLVVDDKVVALAVLFATERGFFDTDELALLDEVASDISFALHAIEKHNRLEYVSYYDVLTGLANRTLFLERASQYIRSAARDGHQLALFLVDLQRFKNINDSLGQAAGDALLKLVAQWLAREVGDVNLLARIDADHFAVVLPKVSEDGSVARLLDRAMDAFEEHPFHLEGGVFRVATKSGVALFPGDGATADALFKNAEAALKKAKASGDRYLFYTAQMTDAVAGKLTLENQLREALDKDEFVLHYQPKVNLMSGKLTGAEALIRWHDPRSGLVPPGRFIPILEETGMINEVGRWAMRQAVEQYLRWLDAGLPAKRIAVNVSPLQLRNRDFVAEVAHAIAIDPRAPAGLELEITENLVMEDVKHSIATLRAIRDLGVTIAIDDFGTGFSSLSYLSKLPVDTLKIDRSFVVEMTSPEARSLVPAIIGLAHSLKLTVVAEGVETEDQSRLLRLLNCDEMQGYLFGKPVPSEIFQAGYLQAPR
jgi:diguanylate cyclase (GGDEF)-like protein